MSLQRTFTLRSGLIAKPGSTCGNFICPGIRSEYRKTNRQSSSCPVLCWQKTLILICGICNCFPTSEGILNGKRAWSTTVCTETTSAKSLFPTNDVQCPNVAGLCFKWHFLARHNWGLLWCGFHTRLRGGIPVWESFSQTSLHVDGRAFFPTLVSAFSTQTLF